MDLNIRYIPNDVNKWDVTRAIARVLHSPDFVPLDVEGRLINFRVHLNDNPAGGVRNDGTGTLTLPTTVLADKFLSYVYNIPIKIKTGEVVVGKGGRNKATTNNTRKLRFQKSPQPPPPWLVETLKKTPYIHPDIEEERQKKLEALDVDFRVDAVQFGVFYQPRYPEADEHPLPPRAFSIEWERQYIEDSYASLKLDYDHKLIRITLGSDMFDYTGYNLVIHFASIRKVGVGYDGKPYICFDTLTPPIMEEVLFHRTMTGDKEVDNRKFKYRVGSIHEGHAIVAPYCPHLRLVLYNHIDSDIIKDFVTACETAGLPTNMIIRCNPGFTQIETVRQGFFNTKRLYALHKTLGKFDWPIAFQLESLLHNGLLNTGDLDELLPRIRTLIAKRAKQSSLFVGQLLRRYNEALQVRPARESPMVCFAKVQDKFELSPTDKEFRCYHVTFTPTRMILEGPYASQSNRVIRQYQGYEDHFIRVDFRDEDRLQYRWSREVDGTRFLTKRVGKILKEGFSLAGRSFEFLAYSSSALRDHAVWFINPFHHTERNCTVNGAMIRDSLGNFKGTKLLQCPSKYAARLAQAFTATDPSVDIKKSEWMEVPDLGQEPFQHTDGVGLISKALGDRIWAKLCEKKRNPERLVQPSAYQIRFLGYKGVVAVNPYLDLREDGIQMQLRPSMGKFQTREADTLIAPLEIAQAFEQPNLCYLNRPLVMLLEDAGVRRDAFQKLQNIAVADAKTIDDSLTQFCNVMGAHRLGSSYRLREILTRLRDQYNMDLTSNGKTVAIDNPFLRQIRQVTVTNILRDIKHSARIPIPDSYLLVGVADEGPAYVGQAGFENMYCLGTREIYACIQRPGDAEPFWIEGAVSVSRSPVAHLGDVQRVHAVGKPPSDRPCLFSHLRNVVVMPSVGDRSLASCLGGGDVDGDLFSVICHDTILPNTIEIPASYTSLPTKDLGRDSTVEDICDFVVEYIHSDLLGLLSDRLLVIADQSTDGMRDRNCVYLAELCSHAVDYPKQGTPLNIDNNQLPGPLIRCKPDWHAAEVVSPRHTDYYESSKALGFLFRAIKLDDPEPIPPADVVPVQPLTDPISIALLASVKRYLGSPFSVPEHESADLLSIFRGYIDELRYICATHTLSNTPGVRLLEAEVVVGTILAKCSQARWRKERMYRMRLHAGTLVRDVQKSLLENSGADSIPELIQALELSWNAWILSLCHRHEFGAQSFGLIALGTLFDCLDQLKTRTTSS